MLHDAETPAGNPVGVPMPPAPVVAMVIFGKVEFMHTVGEIDADPAVFTGVTLIVPVAFALPQPPVKGIL